MTRDDEYMQWVDRTAARGSTTDRLIGLVGSVLVGGLFLALVAVTFWGWVS